MRTADGKGPRLADPKREFKRDLEYARHKYQNS
jgi:hypothetical protein